MGKITRLPLDLADQIAAGEVVERPASVVKELVENALDAGARRIAIHVEQGGKQRLRVEDDGEGMEPDDAQLAIERHATSKIHEAADLAAIATLGFRGEALPSIASVSRFTLRTRSRGHISGTEIRVHGGARVSQTEVGAPEGTSIEVSDLFYNLPARRKFLKSDAAEASQVSRMVTQLAFAYPEVGFALTSGERTVLRCPPAATLGDRLFQLSGERHDLITVSRERAGVRLYGYVARLAVDQAPTRGAQQVYINRRMVKDRTIAHAILDAYRVASIKERSPEVYLFIDMPLDMVDVNVHPAKAEVRFRDQSFIHELVRRAVVDALGQEGAPELQGQQETAGPGAAPLGLPGLLNGGVFPSRWTRPGSWASSPIFDGSPGATAGAGRLPTATEAPTAREGAPSGPMIPLGQYRDTFIIAIDDEGVAIVDQHVAHERVLFERVMQQLTAGRLESQRLLVPLLLDVTPAAVLALLSHRDELARLGFEIEPFGETTIRVGAVVPALLEPADCTQALRALALDYEGLDRGGDVREAIRRIAATTACHAAVKANCPLSSEKMAHILQELRATAFSSVCPHGRPIMLRLTRREIERNFERA